MQGHVKEENACLDCLNKCNGASTLITKCSIYTGPRPWLKKQPRFTGVLPQKTPQEEIKK